MQTPRLFATLPEQYACTPDGMAVYKDGDLILACPNFADTKMPGCLLKIDKDKKIAKWVDVPANPGTGLACPMGIAFGPDWDIYICDNQGWSGAPELQFKGRILRLKITDGKLVKTTVVANHMEHPNGIRIRGGYMYVTQSMLSKVQDPSGKLMSCVYRFGLDEENIEITNTLADRHIFTTFLTLNPDCQYGADGICFDAAGDLYVGNFGDGAVHRIRLAADGSAAENKVWAKDAKELQSTDGICIDEAGNFFVADFSANAVARVTPDGRVTRIAQSPDCTGLEGGLDQPGEPIVWRGRLILSCFDLVTGPDKVNTGHEMPATLAELDPV